MKNAISWFEIFSTQLHQAQAFYEAVLNCNMRAHKEGRTLADFCAASKSAEISGNSHAARAVSMSLARSAGLSVGA